MQGMSHWIMWELASLFEQIGVLLIGAIIDTNAVAIFEAPMRLTLFLSYGGQAVAFGVGPRLARRGDDVQRVVEPASDDAEPERALGSGRGAREAHERGAHDEGRKRGRGAHRVTVADG